MRYTNHLIEFAKVRRGGELFWSKMITRVNDGWLLKCDNYTTDPEAPRYGEEFEARDEDILERVVAAPALRVVK